MRINHTAVSGGRALAIAAVIVFGQVVGAHEAPHASGGVFDPGSETRPWTDKPFNNDPANFQFAVIGDLTGGLRPGVFPDAVRKLNLLQPEFVMSVGDLIEGYTEDVDVLIAEWDDFDGMIDDLQMRFFYVPGNHDISNAVMAELWEERLGPSYYHFVYGDVLFLCLNSEDTRPNHLSEEQLAYIERALDQNPDVRWTLVFLHKPLWVYLDDGVEDTGWERVDEMLDGRRYTVIAGHFHAYTHSTRNDRTHIVLATTGGGSGLRGPSWGQLDHLVWVTMTDNGPVICNLELSGIFGEDMVTQQGRDIIRSLPSEVDVAFSPVFGPVGGSAAVDASLNLRNSTPYALDVTVDFSSAEWVQVEPRILTARIEPEESAVEEVRFAYPGLPENGFPPDVRFQTNLSFSQDETPVLELRHDQVFSVLRAYPVPMAEREIVVDGILDEWDDFGDEPDEHRIILGPDYWSGPADASFAVRVRRDADFVYVAIKVVDDHIYLDDTRISWEQDSVCLRVDARPYEERIHNRDGYAGAGISYIEFLMNPGDDLEDMHEKFIETLPEGSQAACRLSPEGYNMEVAIPWSHFVELQPEGPDGFRLNAYVNDRDVPHLRTQLWWQTPWERDGSVSGSGSHFF